MDGASQALQGRTCGRLLEQKCQSPAIFKQPLLQRPPETGGSVSDKQKGLVAQSLATLDGEALDGVLQFVGEFGDFVGGLCCLFRAGGGLLGDGNNGF